jgi:hypothetical protein
MVQVRVAEDGEPTYSIHRMLQHKILQDMEEYNFSDSYRKAFRLIRKQYPRSSPTQVPEPGAWDVCKKYMAHVSSFHRIFQKNPHAANLKDPNPVEVAELFYDAGFHVWARQNKTGWDGLEFLETANDILDRLHLGAEDELRADIGSIWGLLLLNMGCVDRVKGMERLDHVRHIRKKIWKADSSGKVEIRKADSSDKVEISDSEIKFSNAETDYSLCLLNQYDFEEAGNIMTSCYERYQKWGTEEENPFEYSKYWGNYSVVLMARGEIDKAISYVERCIRLTSEFTGKAAQYYRREFLLGCCLLQKGEIQQALDKHLATLNNRLEYFGKHHEATIQSMYAVSAMHHQLGDVVTAT